MVLRMEIVQYVRRENSLQWRREIITRLDQTQFAYPQFGIVTESSSNKKWATCWGDDYEGNGGDGWIVKCKGEYWERKSNAKTFQLQHRDTKHFLGAADNVNYNEATKLWNGLSTLAASLGSLWTKGFRWIWRLSSRVWSLYWWIVSIGRLPETKVGWGCVRKSCKAS